LLCAAHVNPLPEISHSVEVILIAVAEPFAARVRDPVVPAGDNRIVSVVMAIVTTPAPFWLMNVNAVPMGYATELFAGIVNVRAVVSALGWKMCLPESARTSVYAPDWLFCGIVRKPTGTVPSTVRVLSAPLMVLLVSVTALAAVKTLVGVMIPDSVAMFYSGCVGH
jgi:hypothetical protein